jgi:uncharacterized protein (TIGR00375 family)
MGVIADLHIHSRFSRACSNQLTVQNLEKWARVKGIDLLGTGDFTHPLWNKELHQELTDDGSGILRTSGGFRFIPTTEVANIYSYGGKGRRVHNVMLAPSLDVVDRINAALLKIGRLDYDGRPIFGLSCERLVEMMRAIDERIEIIPAHAWTPWFGVFGSESGFDSLRDAFVSQEKNVHAIETGMSSDPAMNWRISELNSRSIVSFSDAHSFWPWRLGREATIFRKADSYEDIINAIRRRDIEATIETDPAYGKYHWDGHRNCGFSSPPEGSRQLKGLCPKCGRPLIIGVENRVEKITNQSEGNYPDRRPYHKVLPLSELIAAVSGSPVASRKMWAAYTPLVEKFGNEFRVLLDADEAELTRALPNDSALVSTILENREGKIKVKPGYDGVYGVAVIGGREVALEGEGDKTKAASTEKPKVRPGAKQKGLTDFGAV